MAVRGDVCLELDISFLFGSNPFHDCWCAQQSWQ